MQVAPLVPTCVHELNAIYDRPLVDNDYITIPVVLIKELFIRIDDNKGGIDRLQVMYNEKTTENESL